MSLSVFLCQRINASFNEPMWHNGQYLEIKLECMYLDIKLEYIIKMCDLVSISFLQLHNINRKQIFNVFKQLNDL